MINAGGRNSIILIDPMVVLAALQEATQKLREQDHKNARKEAIQGSESQPAIHAKIALYPKKELNRD
jgi:hypothetical protein